MFLTTSELANRLRVTEQTIRSWHAAGKITGMRAGTSGTLRFNPELVADELRASGVQDCDDDSELCLRAWLGGRQTREQQQAVTRSRFDLTKDRVRLTLADTERFAEMQREVRALGDSPMAIGTDSSGGYLQGADFVRRVELAMLSASSMLQHATVVRTPKGGSCPLPMTDDTGNSGAIVSENTQSADGPITLGQIVLGDYPYRSGMTCVPNELIQDSAVPFAPTLAVILGQRVGRILESHFTTGTGAGQPTGVVTSATVAVTAASATGITAEEIVDLYFALDPEYRKNAVWMCHDNICKHLRKLLDGNGHPVFKDPEILGQPPLLLGRPIVPNLSMASTIVAEAKTLLFGSFSRYVVRMARDITLIQSQERRIDFDQTVYEALGRFDGKLANAGTDPVVALQQHA